MIVEKTLNEKITVLVDSQAAIVAIQIILYGQAQY